MHDDYYRKLLKKWCSTSEETQPFICAFEKVRDIPYGSTGERNPEIIVENNLGSCSGKHILLNGLFQELGFTSRVVTCLHHFEKVLPFRDEYPEELKHIIRNNHVLDFHHFIELDVSGRRLKVDATWDKALKDYGFPVNLDWRGDRDTVLAVNPIRFYDETGDIIGLKMKLLSEISSEERAVRARFLELLTDWLQKVRA